MKRPFQLLLAGVAAVVIGMGSAYAAGMFVTTSSIAVFSDGVSIIPTSVAVTSPADGNTYAPSSFDAGCGTGLGDICGTATFAGTGGSVSVSIRQGSGNYWNGTAFGSATEQLLATSGSSAWSYSFPGSNFIADGAYTIRVVATDSSGSASASSTFTMDVTAPGVPTILTKPAAISTVATADFTFTGDLGSSFQCRLDGDPFSSCSSPKSYSGLTDGSHTFYVRSVDVPGNASAASSWTWVVDTTDPSAAVGFPLAAPAEYNGTGFDAGCGTTSTGDLCGTASDTGSGVSSVRLTIRQGTGNYWNGTGFSSLVPVNLIPTGTTTWSYALAASAVTDGSYTVAVTATDVAGRTGTASRTFVIDKTAPVAPAISSAGRPTNPTNSTSASFSFTNTETSATNECQLDGGGYSACSATKTYSGLTGGSHTFSVRALDAAGNAGLATTFTWTIDTTAPAAPTLSVSGRPASPTNSTSASFSFTNTETSATNECQLDGGGYSACSATKTYSGLTGGSHTFLVRAVDEVGNASPATTFTWLIDLVAPASTDVQSFNAGATLGKIESGDSIVLTFSEAIAPATVKTGWSGTSAVSVTLSVSDPAKSANDILTFSGTNLGFVNLGAGTYSSGAFTIPSSMTLSATNQITIVFGTPSHASRVGTNPDVNTTMAWTPTNVITDIATNQLTVTTPLESGTADREF